MPKKYWLMKSEPESFSITDLKNAPQQTTCWDGVRNYQARNFMRAMKRGEWAFFYHSNATPSSLVGIVEIARKAYPDHTAFDPHDKHFDPKSSAAKPTWEMVDVKLREIFAEPIPLDKLREIRVLSEMELLRRGSRLSIQPVRDYEWKTILKLAKAQAQKNKPHSSFDLNV